MGHLLTQTNFSCCVDHLAVTKTFKSKVMPGSWRIGNDSFNLYYVKSKNLIFSDFLSQTTVDDSNPHEIIPISFNLKDKPQENHIIYTEQLRIHTKGSAKHAWVKAAKTFGRNKTLIPEVKPEY